MPALTPPEKLVRSFHFVSAEPSFTSSSSRLPLGASTSSNCTPARDHADLEGTVKAWEGSLVFCDAVPDAFATPTKRSTGTPTSPIEIASSPETDLFPRAGPSSGFTRIRTSFATKESRTAFTPPKNIHPFFQRDFRRSRSSPIPAPPTNRPRLVAHYSSTSASGSQTTEGTASQESRWSVSRTKEVEVVVERLDSPTRSCASESEEEEQVEHRPFRPDQGMSRHADEVAAMMAELDLSSSHSRNDARVTSPTMAKARTTGKLQARSPPVAKHKQSLKPASTVKAPPGGIPRFKPSQPAEQKPSIPLGERKSTNSEITIEVSEKTVVKSEEAVEQLANGAQPEPCPFSPIPQKLFTYRDLPKPHRLVYTNDINEANELLSCLKGNAIAFDMEWPIFYPENAPGRYHTPRTNKHAQAPVALMQFCDQDLVILIHVWDMESIPVKAIEILTDREIYKVGVAIKGDGQKLHRDYPEMFPNGINSLLELGFLARGADSNQEPSKQLISLARLASRYLHVTLDKDSHVRMSKWHKPLSERQRDYAANDVVVSLEIYNALIRMAGDAEIELHLQNYCTTLPQPRAQPPKSVKEISASPGPSPIMSGEAEERYPGVPGRMARVIHAFDEGSTLVEYAENHSIKASTARGYILAGLTRLPKDAIGPADLQRLLIEVTAIDSVMSSSDKTAINNLKERLAAMTTE